MIGREMGTAFLRHLVKDPFGNIIELIFNPQFQIKRLNNCRFRQIEHRMRPASLPTISFVN